MKIKNGNWLCYYINEEYFISLGYHAVHECTQLLDEEKALPYSRMPVNKSRRDDGIRKSLLGNHLVIIQARNIHQCWKEWVNIGWGMRRYIIPSIFSQNNVNYNWKVTL